MTITLRALSSVAFAALLAACGEKTPPAAPAAFPTLDSAAASSFARLALKAITQEYPNKLDHVLNGPADVLGPRRLHPSFFGAYDWHSSVHGHWMLVRLLKVRPGLPEAGKIRSALDADLSAANLAAEAEYLKRPGSASFERMYGWAWLLKLAEELHGWDDPDGRRWAASLQPLADAIVARYLAFLPKQFYPIRRGVHPNTAFGMMLALDYARAVGRSDLDSLLVERSRTYFGNDVNVPAAWEPDGDDFFSRSLIEADLMRRVLAGAGVRALVPRLPAGGGARTAGQPAATGQGDRPGGPRAGAPGRAQPEPGLVHARRRRRAPGERPGPAGPAGIGGAPRGGEPPLHRQRQLPG